MRDFRAILSVALTLAVSTLAVGSLPRHASAQDAYGCIDQLDDAEVSHRLAYLVRAFDEGKRHARMWWYGSLTFALGAVGLTWTLYGLSRDEGQEKREPALLSAVGSGLLVVQTVAVPLRSAFAPQRLARLPEDTPEQRRAKLRRATRELERSAAHEELLRGVMAHLGSVAYAIGTGTFIAVRHDEPFATVQAFLSPPIIGEAKILALPWDATRTWSRYRSFACQPPASGPPFEESLDALSRAADRDPPRVEWSVVPALGGLGVQVLF